MLWILGLGLIGVLVWYIFRTQTALPVLMYHKVDPEKQDMLTVAVPQLEQQLAWLTANAYQTVTLAQVLEAVHQQRPLPRRSVLLTFDDAYVNNLTFALPLLRQFGMNAVLFVPTAYVGGCNEWDGCTEPLMDASQLNQLLPTFELALHSHRHPNYKHLSVADMETDLTANQAAFAHLGLPHVPAFAYPYGGRPKDPETHRAMRELMQRLGIQLGFRIGNRLNFFPIQQIYELQRLDIRGTDSLAQFGRKVRFGKLL